jgi:glycosyltransferase involved in cell wall biosynthesis
MTPIEAMACGTPVVLSAFPGCEQYAEDGVNCLMARYRDPAHIAERVCELRNDPARQARLIEGGLKTADRYDWSEVGRQYARLLMEAHV